jgi:phosphate starvation-inducible PhoH-like protein
MVETERIRRAPIAFMRGTTIEDEVLLVDEAQNLSPEQMLMVLTRIGKNGRIVITGDEDQSDLNSNLITGLDYAIALSEKLPYVQQIKLTENMRDPMINEIVETWSTLNPRWLTKI